MIVENISKYWFFLILGCIGLIAVLILARFLFRRYFKEFRDFKIETWVGLHFCVPGCDGRNLIIKIQKFSALENDITIVSDQIISDFQLCGYFFKELRYSWDAELVDNFSGQRCPINQTASLKLYQAHLVANLVNGRFCCKPVLIVGKKLTKAKIRNGPVSRSRPTTPNVPKKIFQPVASAPLESTENLEMTDFV